jgi:hypothetical protein
MTSTKERTLLRALAVDISDVKATKGRLEVFLLRA